MQDTWQGNQLTVILSGPLMPAHNFIFRSFCQLTMTHIAAMSLVSHKSICSSRDDCGFASVSSTKAGLSAVGPEIHSPSLFVARNLRWPSQKPLLIILAFVLRQATANEVLVFDKRGFLDWMRDGTVDERILV